MVVEDKMVEDLLEDDGKIEAETMEALMKAKKAFEQHLESLGYDPAYWRIKFIADGLDSEFTGRLWRVVYDSKQESGGFV